MPVNSTDPNRLSAASSAPPSDVQPSSVAAGLAQAAVQSLKAGGSLDSANDAMMSYLNNALGLTQGPSTSSDNGLLSIPDGESSNTTSYSGDLLSDSSSLDDSSTSTTSARDISDPTLAAGETESSQTIDSLYPSGSPSIRDVNQGNLGDCYALAPLASMAATPQGQALLQQAIEPVNSTPPTYDVHMYSPDGKPVTISVDGSTVSDGVKGADGGSNWASVMEKAWAKYNDTYDVNKDNGQSSAKGYAGIGSGGFSSDIYQALTGKPAVYSAEFHNDSGGDTANTQEVSQQIKDQLKDGQFVTAYSNLGPANGVEGQDPIATTAGGTNIIGGHAYSVLGVDGDNVILRNPWGNKGSGDAGANSNPPGVIRMPMSEFVKDFRYTIASGN